MSERYNHGGAVRAARLARGMTLRDLSRETGYSVSYLRNVERRPWAVGSHRFAWRIYKALGVCLVCQRKRSAWARVRAWWRRLVGWVVWP